MFITKDLKTSNGEDSTYVINSLTDTVEPVVNLTKNAIKPFTSDKVSIAKTFYDRNGNKEEQENSLIYYENTYLQNSGIIYSSDEEFDVVASLDGVVIDAKKDEILNNVVYISHDNNITTIYYGIKDINVHANDQISQGEVIGKSDKNKFIANKYSLLFEINNDGNVINPEELYKMDFASMN